MNDVNHKDLRNIPQYDMDKVLDSISEIQHNSLDNNINKNLSLTLNDQSLEEGFTP